MNRNIAVSLCLHSLGVMLSAPQSVLMHKHVYFSGAYNVEKYSDFSWCLVAYGMNLVYHFVVLQVVAIVSMLTVHCHFSLLESQVVAE